MACPKFNFPEGKYGHPLFYLHFVSNLCEYAKPTFNFINLTIEDTREQKYFIGRQYSAIKDGIKNSCDKKQNHVLPKLCGAEVDWFPTLIKLHFRYAYDVW